MRTNPKLSPNLNAHGHYEIRWSEVKNGKWRSRRKSTGCSDYSQAISALADFMAIKPVADDTHTVRAVFDFYLRYHSRPLGNEKTDRQNMRAPLEAFGDLPAGSVTNMSVELYSRQRQTGKFGSVAVKPATVRRELVALQAVLNFGSKRGLIPGDKVFAFPKPKDGKPRDKWINEDQQAEIVERLREASLDVQIFTRLALTYGVRKGAILGLRFGPQIDFLSGTIDFNPPDAVATRKRRPKVPMTKTIRADLEMMFAAKQRGDTVCGRSTYRDYGAFMESIGYGWVTPHVLKHSAITLMLRAGVPDGDVAKLTATDLRTIYRVYRHHTVEELTAIAEARGI